MSVLLHRDEGTGKRVILSANVGDSRAILCRDWVAKYLTVDHKPNSPGEKFRVEGLGGEVQWCGMRHKKTGGPLFSTGVYQINGNLAVSRAIGDYKGDQLTT